MADSSRVPPGQTVTKKWPVLHYVDVPKVTQASFCLKVFGLVERPVEWTLAELEALGTTRVTADFHCVTTWSLLDNLWEGVLLRTVGQAVGIKPEAKYVMAYGSDGYETNVALDWLMQDDVLLAFSHNGQPLSAEHGGPVRLIVPKLYGWKSAKWISGLEFMKNDRRGYWKERGYHNRGEPFAEERYSYQETE